LLALGLAAAIMLALRPRPIPVDVSAAGRGPLQVTVDASGHTRVARRYVVAAPTNGHLSRITLQAGDRVESGQQLAILSAAPRAPLGPLEQTEVAARAAAASAAEAESHAAVERARLGLEQSRRDLERTERLAASGALPAQQVESARLEEQVRARELAAAEAATRRARNEVQAALAVQGKVRPGVASESLAISAPCDGTVLRVLTESEGPVAAGTPLLEVGDLGALEVVVDVPTTQAVRVSPGARVVLDGWGGRVSLTGKVRLVESGAFTKISALGVEEQRVNVVIDRAGDEQAWALLGDGYRVEARIVVWERPDALQVPIAALAREGDRWRAFVVSASRAVSRTIEIGERNGRHAEVVAGLEPGELVVLYPGDQVTSGVLVLPTQKD
jgi:HlyD family secretion protein